MVKITKLTKIDHVKLNALFKKRGHGIISENFLPNINTILDDPDSPFEVHQCDCGEVLFIQKSEAEKQRSLQKNENISCWKCLGLKEGKLSFLLIKKIKDIEEILQKNKSNPDKVSVLAEIRIIGKGIIPTGNLDEVFIGLNDLKRRIKEEPYRIYGIPLEKNPIIDNIIFDAVTKDGQLAENLLKALDIDGKNQASENCDLRFIAINQITTEMDKLKFFGVPYEDYFPHTSEEETKKVEINQKMTLYKDLFELGKFYLDFLLNLINVIDGKSVQKDPFDQYTIPTKNGTRPVSGIFDKVLLFSHIQSGKKVYPILQDIFDNRLRNDDGHNQYEINFQKHTIHSLKYQTEITFKDLDKKIAQLSHFFDYLDNFWVEYYLKLKKDEIKNLGIDEVSFCYQDSFVVEGDLFPLGDVLPVLNVFQYWNFAQLFDGKRYIPYPNITIDDQVRVSFDNGNTISYPLNSNMELWLSQLFLHEKFELTLFTIAPLIPSFTKEAIIKAMKINEMLDMNILYLSKKEIALPTKLKQEIQSILALQ